MKTLKKSLFALMLCLVMLLSLTTAAMAAEANPSTDDTCDVAPTTTEEEPDAEPPALPTTAGIHIGTINKYTMKYSRSYYDAELGGLVLVFGLSDAGKLEALTRYCCPSYQLPDELALLRNALDAGSDDYARPRMNVQAMLNELLLNGGGGPNYNYVPLSEVLETAQEVIETDEFKAFVEATKPLAECPKTDARTLALTYTETELAEICDNLREKTYGEWHLRLEWLDEMEFSLLIPFKATVDAPVLPAITAAIPTPEA